MQKRDKLDESVAPRNVGQLMSNDSVQLSAVPFAPVKGKQYGGAESPDCDWNRDLSGFADLPRVRKPDRTSQNSPETRISNLVRCVDESSRERESDGEANQKDGCDDQINRSRQSAPGNSVFEPPEI